MSRDYESWGSSRTTPPNRAPAFIRPHAFVRLDLTGFSNACRACGYSMEDYVHGKVAADVVVGDWLFNRTTGERIARIAGRQQARASGYVVFTLDNVAPNYRSAYPNNQTSQHVNDVVVVDIERTAR